MSARVFMLFATALIQCWILWQVFSLSSKDLVVDFVAAHAENTDRVVRAVAFGILFYLFTFSVIVAGVVSSGFRGLWRNVKLNKPDNLQPDEGKSFGDTTDSKLSGNPIVDCIIGVATVAFVVWVIRFVTWPLEDRFGAADEYAIRTNAIVRGMAFGGSLYLSLLTVVALWKPRGNARGDVQPK